MEEALVREASPLSSLDVTPAVASRPLERRERITALDTLRGFAMLGILTEGKMRRLFSLVFGVRVS